MEDLIRTTLKQDFARWMRKHLGYQSCALDFPVNDAEASRTRFASVRGENYGIGWYHLRSAAVVLLATSLIARVLVPVRESDVPVVATSLAYVALACYLFSHVGRMLTRRYSWVECKELERPMTRDEVARVKNLLEGVRRSTAATWKPTKILLVVGTHGFDEAAVGAARAMGIECYQRSKRGFHKLS
jgi:hypothetical protein